MSEKKTEADVAFIKALAELLQENDLTELEVMREYGDDDSLQVRISRVVPVAAPAIAAPAAPVAHAAPAVPPLRALPLRCPKIRQPIQVP